MEELNSYHQITKFSCAILTCIVLLVHSCCYVLLCPLLLSAYTPAGGHITVEASLQSRNVIIAVLDDGPGVAPEHQSRIFDRFYRADKNRTDRAHSGLGLSIAKKVVNDHGGKLTYKTAMPHGSVFSIILPCLPGRKPKRSVGQDCPIVVQSVPLAGYGHEGSAHRIRHWKDQEHSDADQTWEQEQVSHQCLVPA